MDAVDTLAEGTRNSKSGENWTNWWLFRGNLGEDQVRAFYELEGIHSYYGGPGDVYSKGPIVRRSRSYTLILENCGYDI